MKKSSNTHGGKEYDFSTMKNTISKAEAIDFVKAIHADYKAMYESYDDEYSLEDALNIISKASSDTIEVENVSHMLNPYLDALWAKLEGRD